MEDRLIVVLIILLMGLSVGIYTFIIAPEINQLTMYPYNNEFISTDFGYKQYITCPIDNHTDNITFIGMPEEHRTDWEVQGMRLKVVTIWYCHTHNLEFSVR